MFKIIFENSTSVRCHQARIRQLLNSTGGRIRVASPYVTEANLIASSKKPNRVYLLTRCSIGDIAVGATAVDALEILLDAGVHLQFIPEYPKLHGKVYIFGNQTGLVSSANLTSQAMRSNLEVGVEFTGPQVDLVTKWFDELWYQSTAFTSEKLRLLRAESAALKREFARFNKALRAAESLTVAGSDMSPVARAFSDTDRFFVCNTDRRSGITPSGAYEHEQYMHMRGYAAAWEPFKYTTHIEQVRAGDMVFAFAKGVGIMGVGRALSEVEVLASHDSRRDDAPGNGTMWRIGVEWLSWRDSWEAFEWRESLRPTFSDISSEKYAGLRTRLKEHFSIE